MHGHPKYENHGKPKAYNQAHTKT